MKKILFCIILCAIISIGIFPSHAQEQAIPTLLENDVRTCPEYDVSIVWGIVSKVWQQTPYAVESTVPAGEIATINHEIWSWPDIITVYETSTANHVFDEQWSFLMKTLLTTRTWCTYVAQETVNVYNDIFLYIWPGSDEYDLVKNTMQQESTYLGKITIAGDSLLQQDEVVSLLVENKFLIESADMLMIDSQALWVVLWSLPEVERVVPLTVDGENVYVLSSINQSAFRRLVATYRSIVWLKSINVVPQNSVWSLVSALLLDKNPKELWLVKTFTTETFWSKKWLVLSHFVNSLLIYGMPLQFLVFLLLIPVVVLVITIYRQVVWFTIFGVSASLLLWLAVYSLGTLPTIILLALWWISIIANEAIIKRVFVLSTPKIAITYTLYVLLLLMIFVLQYKYWFEIFSLSELTNPYAIFIVMYMMVASKSIFKDASSILRKKRLYGLIQGSVVIFSIVLLFRWNWLHNVLLGYPETIVAVLVCIFLVWRYTWLQVTEYIRFMPLISRTLNEHEEE